MDEKKQNSVSVDPRKGRKDRIDGLMGSLKKINSERSTNRVARLLVKHWPFPKGQSRPAVILWMNCYVKDHIMKIYIPGEIALSSFNIDSGISPEHYWTLIDPGKNIPKGNGVAIAQRCEKYGFPGPDYSLHFQKYERIIQEMDKFIMEASENKKIARCANSRTFNSGYVIFCLRERIPKFTQSLQWLYKQAGQEFRHRMLPLESLLVTLSMGGLENIAKRTQRDFPTVVSKFTQATQTASSLASTCKPTAAVHEVQMRLQDVIDKFVEEVAGKSRKNYEKTGEVERRACQQAEQYPYAMLGAFTFEEQATHYLSRMDYLYVDSLACDFHQINSPALPPELAAWIRRKPRDSQPNFKMTKCALINVKRLIFLALDVLLVNYKVKAVEGKHYPKL